MAKSASILILFSVFILISGCTRVGLVPNPPESAAQPPVQQQQPDGEKAEAGKPETEEAPAEEWFGDAAEPDKKSADEKPGDEKTAEAEVPSDWDESLPDRQVRTLDVDFARAFEESPTPRETVLAPSDPAVVHSLRYPSLRAKKRPVRVMVRRNVKDAVVYSAATVEARTPGMRTTFRGRMQIEADLAGPGAVVATVNKVRKELRLPCTLLVSSGAHLIDVGESSYRGAVVIVSEGRGTFSLINILNVEEYLRGVVPLEIGNLAEADIEAVKAQAVAARTYTYRKMAANEKALFDVVSTVADQVYGGAKAEAATSDAAIRLTKDLIMAHEDDIVRAYYHSTCGGRTANIEDVWGGEGVAYLRSQNDSDDKGGRAFCAGSGSFSWTDTWTDQQLTGIVKRYSSEGSLTPPLTKGSIKRIDVRERFGCGRVKRVVITSTANEEHTTGGDKLRFVIRRNTQSRQVQILRSSNIRSVTAAGGKITITGGGHGHGVGMCQVGAIGRARAGHNFEQILKSYYSGVLLRTVVNE